MRRATLCNHSHSAYCITNHVRAFYLNSPVDNLAMYLNSYVYGNMYTLSIGIYIGEFWEP
jgi:hypothetical protein